MCGGGGFTLAELLIVMAIIVVLAAVAVPTFGKQLETARESNDAEEIRAVVTDAFTEAYMDYMNNGSTAVLNGTTYVSFPKDEGADVTFKQTKTGFNYVTPTFTVGNATVTANSTTSPATTTEGVAVGSKKVVVTFDPDGSSGIKIKDITVGGTSLYTAP